MRSIFILIYSVAGLIGVYALFQFGLLLWLWLVHDLPCIRIRKRLYQIPIEINEQMRGRGITRDEYDRQVAIAQKPLKAELELREYKRKIWLDRLHIILIIKPK